MSNILRTIKRAQRRSNGTHRYRVRGPAREERQSQRIARMSRSAYHSMIQGTLAAMAAMRNVFRSRRAA